VSDQQHEHSAASARPVPHEELVGAALESAAPSRASVWARFAAGAIALEKGGHPVGAPAAAGLADAMLAEYDIRFPTAGGV
jgi:hypothetical protein